MKKQFRDFESAREFVRSLGLKNLKEWREFVKSGEKPDDIPANLDTFYKNKGWIGLSDFLGIERKKKTYREFNKAREFARSLGLKDQKEWKIFTKSNKLPKDIPANPGVFYSDFSGYADWLGVKLLMGVQKYYLTFEKARELVRAKNSQHKKI